MAENTAAEPAPEQVGKKMARDIDIPAGTATWVLLAHLFVLFSAVPVIWYALKHQAELGLVVNPYMLCVAAVVYTTGVAFEISQNASDKWYLTEASTSMADCLFYWMMICGFCIATLAIRPEGGLVWYHWIIFTVAVVAAIAHPVFYMLGHWGQFPALTWSMIMSDLALFLVLGDPIVFLHTIITMVGLGYLALLLTRHSQWLHGVAATLFGVSMFPWPWAMHNHATGVAASWSPVLYITLAAAVIYGLGWPVLSKMNATVRKSTQVERNITEETQGSPALV